jgi:hypothetical protein
LIQVSCASFAAVVICTLVWGHVRPTAAEIATIHESLAAVVQDTSANAVTVSAALDVDDAAAEGEQEEAEPHLSGASPSDPDVRHHPGSSSPAENYSARPDLPPRL